MVEASVYLAGFAVKRSGSTAALRSQRVAVNTVNRERMRHNAYAGCTEQASSYTDVSNPR